PPPACSPPVPYTTLFRSSLSQRIDGLLNTNACHVEILQREEISLEGSVPGRSNFGPNLSNRRNQPRADSDHRPALGHELGWASTSEFAAVRRLRRRIL